MVTDLVPVGSSRGGIAFPTAVGNKLFFGFDDGVHGDELWVSDGTADGTKLVLDIAPGTASFGLPADASPSSLTAVGNTLFFTTSAVINGGRQLWKSDGTPGGTIPLTATSLGPSALANAGGTLFFQNVVGLDGELWKSDGTPGGTGIVKNINTSIAVNGVELASNPTSITAVGNRAFFVP